MVNIGEKVTGGNVNRPPLLYGERFENWKDKLRSFNISHDPSTYHIEKDEDI